MTTPDSRLGDIIAATRHLFLDFDGPICSIFAGLKPETIATGLRDIITAHDIAMPADVIAATDPFGVFTWAATVSPDLAAEIESAMTDLEVSAVPTAEPTPGVHGVITSCRESGRTITVVSNNSDRAVRAYLTRHALDGPISTVIARTTPDPTLLKPCPHLLEQAIIASGAEPDACALVGDQLSDIEAARHAGTHSIGYANKPGKAESFANAGAGAVITSLTTLTLAIRARP
jgi:HAD superfamily hydrolase (TIGR01509 family)